MEDGVEEMSEIQTPQIEEPLLLETVWLKQTEYEKHECQYQVDLSDRLVTGIDENQGCHISEPLLAETVWLKQTEFETAECRYQMHLSGCLLKGQNKTEEKTVPSDSTNRVVTMPKSNQMKKGKHKNREGHKQVLGRFGAVTFKAMSTTEKRNSEEKGKESEIPFGTSYADKLDVIMTQLDTKRKAFKKAFDGFDKSKHTKVTDMRESLRKLRNVVERYSDEMEQQFEIYQQHVEEGRQFLQTLQSTTESIRDVRKGNVVPKHMVGWKAIYAKMHAIDNDMKVVLDAGLQPNMRCGDVTAKLRRSILDLKCFQLPKPLQKQIGKYPRFTEELNVVDDKIAKYNGVIRDCEEEKREVQTVSGEAHSDIDGDNTESLEGSLAEECLSDGWVSITDLVTGDGNAHARETKTKLQTQNKQTLISKNQSSTSSPKSNSTGKGKKKKKNQQKPVIKKERVEDDNESLDGSLGSEDCLSDSGGDLIACFASLQKGGGDGARGKSNNHSSTKSSSKKSASPSSNTKATPNHAMTKSNSNRGKTGGMSSPQSSSKQSCTKSSESNSRSGPAKSSPDKTKGLKKTATPRHRYEGELTDISLQMRDILAVFGPTIQVREMIAEADALLHLLMSNEFDQDAFRHRFSSLKSAVRYCQQQIEAHAEASSIHTTTLQQPKATKSTSPNKNPANASAGKSKKSEKKKKTVDKQVQNIPSLLTVNQNFVSKVFKMAEVDPCARSDRHRAGISSMVVLDDTECIVMVDIINGCLKLFDISKILQRGSAKYIQSVNLHQPYYMTKAGNDVILVSMGEKKISVLEVSRDRNLVVRQMISCRDQYYGLGWVHSNIVACANYDRSSIDLIRILGNQVELVKSFQTHSEGPELLSVIPASGNIVFLERVLGRSMHVTCIDTINGNRLYSMGLGGGSGDVWNLACMADKIVCCSKNTNNIILLSPSDSTGRRMLMQSVVPVPMMAVKMPFAICISKGLMYVANDAAWEEDRNHYVTTQVKVYSVNNLIQP